MKILVVDDEKLLVKGIKFNLEAEGYSVQGCYDGEEAVRLASEESFDLIILDLMMPKKDGLQTCQEIRGFSTVPIIMLTARSENSDMLMGFESGADDYITKPFNILELKARVRALIRRSTITASQLQEAAAVQQEPDNLLKAGDIVVAPELHQVTKGGTIVDLTLKEYDLLEFFMRNPFKVYSRDSLLNLVWGYDYTGDSRTVDVHVRRLREKLENDPAHPSHLMTKWGVGYYFSD